VVFRVAPLTSIDASEMVEELKAAPLFGPFRGEPEVDRDALALALVAIGAIGLEHPEIASIDVNPMIVAERRPVAVDALIERVSVG
jgi:acetyl-CoA synthetase (ADP-forming)